MVDPWQLKLQSDWDSALQTALEWDVDGIVLA